MKKKKEITELNADLNIVSNFGQNKRKANKFKKDMEKFLKPLQEAGLLEFKAISFRKCDFCGNKIEDGMKFKTIGEKDKCGDCLKK